MIFLYGATKNIPMVIINRYLFWPCLYMNLYILPFKENMMWQYSFFKYMLGSKDLGSKYFRTSMCNVGKP